MERVWKRACRKSNEKLCYICPFSLLGGISGSKGIASPTVNVRARWSWMLSITTRPCWPLRTGPGSPLNVRLVVLEKRKISLRLPGNRTTIPRLPRLQCSQCRDCTVLEKFDTHFMLDIILTIVLWFWDNSTKFIFMLCRRLFVESFYWCPLSFFLLKILILQSIARYLLHNVKR